MLAVACARSPLGRHRPGGLPAGLTRRAQLLTTFQRCAPVPHLPCAASAPGGFLADIFESNGLIRQQLSALASTDFQANLVWTEVAATRSAAVPDLTTAPGTQAFKDTLRDVAISMSSAHGKEHVVFVKWRSETAAADGVARTTLYNVGFKPPELAAEFLRRAKLSADTAVGGFRIHGHSVSAVELTEGKGFRFYVPIPPGWTDEELCLAMIMQGGLDLVRDCLVELESTDYYRSTVLAEPQLGRRGLYHTMHARTVADEILLRTNVLAYADGEQSRADMADLFGVPVDDVRIIVNELIEHDLLTPGPLRKASS